MGVQATELLWVENAVFIFSRLVQLFLGYTLGQTAHRPVRGMPLLERDAPKPPQSWVVELASCHHNYLCYDMERYQCANRRPSMEQGMENPL